MPRPTWAIVLAGGSGTRFGGGQKVLFLVGGKRVIDHALDSARAAVDGVVAVIPQDWRIGDFERRADAVVTGGATRSESVRAGLAAVPDEAEVVVVHDAARPLATVALFKAVIEALADPEVDAAIPGVPVVDTLKRVEGDRVAGTVPREKIVAVQTPQAFRAAALRAAHASGRDATDDAALVEEDGGRVTVVPGEEANIKITVVRDLILARALADPHPRLES